MSSMRKLSTSMYVRFSMEHNNFGYPQGRTRRLDLLWPCHLSLLLPKIKLNSKATVFGNTFGYMYVYTWVYVYVYTLMSYQSSTFNSLPSPYASSLLLGTRRRAPEKCVLTIVAG